MAQPTQELPPWYTASIDTLVDVNGVPFTTSTTLLFLPLTYYGPSIPLGPDWTYGGLTSPASTSSIPITTAIPTTSATPSESETLTPIPSITSSVSESISITPSTTTPFSSESTSALPSSTTAGPAPTLSSNARGSPSLIGIIIGSVFGGIFLLFVLALYICLSRRKRRSQPRFSIVDPSDEEFYVVGSNDWQGSRGDEIDPFISQHPSRQNMGEIPPTVGLVTPRAPPRAPHAGTPPQTRPVSGTHTMSSNGSSNSGYGNLIDVPTLGMTGGAYAAAYGPVQQDDGDDGYQQRRGPILTPGELSRLDEEASVAHSHEMGYSPLVPPPRLDPDQFGIRSVSPTSHRAVTPTAFADVPPQDSQGSLGTKRSSYPVDAEEAKTATVMTARRVRVEDLGPRSPLSEKSSAPTSPRSPTSPLLRSGSPDRRGSGSGAWLAGFGLGSLANSLGRMSFFKGSDSPRASTSRYDPQSTAYRPSEYVSRPLSDDEYEAGQIALLDPEKADEGLLQPTVRRVPPGRTGETEQPVSSLSGKSATSGNTVYLDAQSSLGNSSRGVPSPAPRSIPPTPSPGPQTRTHTPHSFGQRHDAEPLPQNPPNYDDSNLNPSPRASYPGASALAIEPEVDILDMPVPSPMLPPRTLAPITLRSSDSQDLPSIGGSDATSGVSRSLRVKEGLLMPPGLWQDTSTITSGNTEGTSTRAGMDTPSFGSLAMQAINMRHMHDDGPITIDILEELPPSAGEGWRSLAQAHGGGDRLGHLMDLDRRRTFGMPPHITHPTDITSSEHGSLHSMRSHLAPGSAHSSGSAPASPPSSSHGRMWTSGSIGSNSSRPSARSAALSGSSGSALSHQGSFTRTRPGTDGAIISPAVSAFGHGTEPSGVSISSRLPSPTSPTIPQQAYYSRPVTASSAGLSLIPVVEHPHGGLDQNWTPT
ncbi:hypothetical protein ONZ45_g2495 [Pleurotus djamor]|nr:hypothetical protein ONZ45_g2495 [Pleurotus djamor]